MKKIKSNKIKKNNISKWEIMVAIFDIVIWTCLIVYFISIPINAHIFHEKATECHNLINDYRNETGIKIISTNYDKESFVCSGTKKNGEDIIFGVIK